MYIGSSELYVLQLFIFKIGGHGVKRTEVCWRSASLTNNGTPNCPVNPNSGLMTIMACILFTHERERERENNT